MHQCSPRNSTIVDGINSPASPASTINGIRSPNCSITSRELEHVVDPVRFALVPVKGTPNSSIKWLTILFLGHRSAIRRVFPVTFSGKRLEASTTIVNGPGQHAFASR